MTERDSFGPSLRRQREQRGLTLETVADAIKVSPCLLAALERGDLSRWPAGIYRRSFLRGYAVAIGAPPEPTLRDFLRLFPDPGQVRSAGDAGSGRLTLMPEPRWRLGMRRALAAACDALAVLLLGYGAAMLTGVTPWPAVTAAALVWAAGGTLLFGQSPAVRYLAASAPGRARASVAEDVGLLRRRWTAAWTGSGKRASASRATT